MKSTYPITVMNYSTQAVSDMKKTFTTKEKISKRLVCSGLHVDIVVQARIN